MRGKELSDALWEALSPEERREALDNNSKATAYQIAGSTALDAAMKSWIEKYEVLVRSGAEPVLAKDICFEGWKLQRAFLNAVILASELEGLELEGSRNIIKQDQARAQAFQALEANYEDDLHWTVFSDEINKVFN